MYKKIKIKTNVVHLFLLFIDLKKYVVFLEYAFGCYMYKYISFREFVIKILFHFGPKLVDFVITII